MRRDLGIILLLLILLAGLGAVAWLTHHPEAPILERAERWPVVAPVARWFRERYLAPAEPTAPPSEDGEDEGGVEVVWVEREAPEWEPPPPGPRQVVWVLPGTVMRRAPEPGAAPVREFDRIVNALKVERRGDWFRIRYLADEGWVYLEGYDESGAPPYGVAAELPRPMRPRPPLPERLAAARTLLHEGGRETALGPYRLYTDCPSDALLVRLDRLAARLEPIYVARYGRQPLGTPEAALVLYRSELPYRVLQSRSDGLLGLNASGHAASGLAVLYRGERSGDDVAATLVHELVHLLNRRALGPALPPWLDEGLADDLAAARIDEAGDLDPRRLGGERLRERSQLRVDGALATLYALHRAVATGRLPTLAELLELDWEGFVRSGDHRLHYGASAFFIRFLLHAEDGRHAGAFRAFLDDVAAGRPATAEALRQRLGLPWEDLDRQFRGWIEVQATWELGDLLPELDAGAGG